MALIGLTSARGAPGVTTTALGMALHWHRPVLLVEADASGGSAILAGYLRGTVAHDRGLRDVAVALSLGDPLDQAVNAALIELRARLRGARQVRRECDVLLGGGLGWGRAVGHHHVHPQPRSLGVGPRGVWPDQQAGLNRNA